MKCDHCKEEKKIIFLGMCKKCFRANYEHCMVDDFVLMNDAGRVLHIDDVEQNETGYIIEMKLPKNPGRLSPEEWKKLKEIIHSPEFKKQYLAWKMK